MEQADRLGLMKKEAVETGPAPLGIPFSPAVKVGELLFVSGQGPIDKTGKVIPGDIRAQTKATLENFKRIMEAAGSSLDNVLQTTVYLKDLAEYSAMNETYSSFFNDPKPARTTVQAGDLLFGMKVEIQGIAYVPGKQKKN
jgi:2-iminobutanoate/2-iminopropanoate deaminase